MTTPFGPAVAGPLASKKDFYEAYPRVGEGWPWKEHPGSAPLGADLKNLQSKPWETPHISWLLTFCFPRRGGIADEPKGSTTGIVTAFDRTTDETYVLDIDITFADAVSKYPS